MDGVEIHNPYRLFGLTSAFNPETVERFELTAGRLRREVRRPAVVAAGRGEPRRRRATAPSRARPPLSLTDANVILEGRLPEAARRLVALTGAAHVLRPRGRALRRHGPARRSTTCRAACAGTLGGGPLARGLRPAQPRGHGRHVRRRRRPGSSGDFVTRARNDLAAAALPRAAGRAASPPTRCRLVPQHRRARRGRAVPERPAGARTLPATRARSAWPTSIFDRDGLRARRLAAAGARAARRPPARWSRRASSCTACDTRRGLRHQRRPQPDRGATAPASRGGAGLPDDARLARSTRRAAGAWLQDRVAGHAGPDRSSRACASTGATSTGGPPCSPRLGRDPRASTRPRGCARRAASTRRAPATRSSCSPTTSIDLTGGRALDLDSERARARDRSGIERDLGPGSRSAGRGVLEALRPPDRGRGWRPRRSARRALARLRLPAPSCRTACPRSRSSPAAPTNDGRGRAYGFDVYARARRRPTRAHAAGPRTPTASRRARRPTGAPTRSNTTGGTPSPWSRPGAPATLRAVADRTLRVAASPARRCVDAARGRRRRRTWRRPRRRRQPRGAGARSATRRAGRSGRPTSAASRTCQSARLPAFARVDLRATWKPRGAAGRWQFYLDVINLLNRENAGRHRGEPRRTTPAPTGRASIEERAAGIPFLPSVGVRFRF